MAAADTKLGPWGEALAAELLRRRGYHIVATNYRSRYGEIDIIAENAEYLVFAEVKRRKKVIFSAVFDNSLFHGLVGVAVKQLNRNFIGNFSVNDNNQQFEFVHIFLSPLYQIDDFAFVSKQFGVLFLKRVVFAFQFQFVSKSEYLQYD